MALDLAVTDIFVAVSENRPYREAMNMEKTEKVMRGMAAANKISGRITEMMLDMREIAGTSGRFSRRDGFQQVIFANSLNIVKNIS